MIRFRQVAQWWSWLPAFRGVAEHESIQDASAILGVSPSALSRTVRLLEDGLGRQLFLRAGNSMTLTPFGRDLLAATRDSMRIVDDCVQRAEAEDQRSRVISALATTPVASALLAVVAAENARGSMLAIGSLDESDVAGALLRGDTDLVLVGVAPEDASLLVEPLGSVAIGVYAAQTHALAIKTGSLQMADLAGLEFVARADDGWPSSETRTVAVSTTSLEAVLLLCRSGLLCTLPDVFAARLGSGLVRLCEAGPAPSLFAVRRRPLPGHDTRPLDAIVAWLRASLASG